MRSKEELPKLRHNQLEPRVLRTSGLIYSRCQSYVLQETQSHHAPLPWDRSHSNDVAHLLPSLKVEGMLVNPTPGLR